MEGPLKSLESLKSLKSLKSIKSTYQNKVKRKSKISKLDTLYNQMFTFVWLYNPTVYLWRHQHVNSIGSVWLLFDSSFKVSQPQDFCLTGIQWCLTHVWLTCKYESKVILDGPCAAEYIAATIRNLNPRPISPLLKSLRNFTNVQLTKNLLTNSLGYVISSRTSIVAENWIKIFYYRW